LIPWEGNSCESQAIGGVTNKVTDLAGGVGNAWANTGGGVVNWAAGHPGDVLAWATAIAVTGAVCLGLGAGTACAVAALAYFAGNGTKNWVQGKPSLEGANPLDMALSVTPAAALDKLSVGAGAFQRFVTGSYAGGMSDATSQIARHPGQLPNPCELAGATLGGGISNVLPSGTHAKDIFFGGFISSGLSAAGVCCVGIDA
jgi:hypothetical protein